MPMVWINTMENRPQMRCDMLVDRHSSMRASTFIYVHVSMQVPPHRQTSGNARLRCYIYIWLISDIYRYTLYIPYIPVYVHLYMYTRQICQYSILYGYKGPHAKVVSSKRWLAESFRRGRTASSPPLWTWTGFQWATVRDLGASMIRIGFLERVPIQGLSGLL